MPNWAENQITVTGSQKQISKFNSFVDEEFDFEKIIPYPEEYKKADDESNGRYAGYNSGGYEWCFKNWGTKWGAGECLYFYESCKSRIVFQTAWSPSLPVTMALSKKFPHLKFEHVYCEPGMGFSGVSVFKKGSIIEEFASDNYEEYAHKIKYS